MVSETPIETGIPPVMYNKTMFTNLLSAQLAALFNESNRLMSHDPQFSFTYRKHKLILVSDNPVVPEFWLPVINSFIFVYPQWPTLNECQDHESIAKLGHNVIVFVGTSLSPAVRCDGFKGVMHGWTLAAFTGNLMPGWTSFIQDYDRLRIQNIVHPADTAACSERLLQAMNQAIEEVSSDTTSSTVKDLSATLGKSLRLK